MKSLLVWNRLYFLCTNCLFFLAMAERSEKNAASKKGNLRILYKADNVEHLKLFNGIADKN